jgi:hypothetical protein
MKAPRFGGAFRRWCEEYPRSSDSAGGWEPQNENLTEPCMVRGARVLVTRPKFAFV